MRVSFFLALLSIGLISCFQKADESQMSSVSGAEKSLHFSIEQDGKQKIITVFKPFVGGEISEKYLLYPKGTKVTAVEGITHYIATPVERLAINSTTFLGYLAALGEMDKVKAASNLDLFYNSEFVERIEEKKVQSIGNRSIDHERLIDSKCELIFSYAIDGSGLKEIERLRELGQEVILSAEFMEQKPLDKANWLRFFAAFFNKERLADSILHRIESAYVSIENKAKGQKEIPSVMVGLPWKGSWFVSGGSSFQANYFKAANANYIWKHKKQEGGVPLTFETVLNDAMDADYWINPGSANSYEDLMAKDERFQNFKPYKNQMIYTNYKRSNALGGNDYWESGVVRADLVLKDLVCIFHPELYPNYALTYHKKLGNAQ